MPYLSHENEKELYLLIEAMLGALYAMAHIGTFTVPNLAPEVDRWCRRYESIVGEERFPKGLVWLMGDEDKKEPELPESEED